MSGVPPTVPDRPRAAVAPTVIDRPRKSFLARHWWKVAAPLGVLVLAAYFALGPYLTLMKLKRGVEKRDAEAVAECIDFPALRQSLKGQLQTVVSQRLEGENNPLAALAAGFAVSVADGLVDRMVSPDGLATLMAGQKPALVGGPPAVGAPARKPLEGATFGYAAFGEFVVDVPTQGGNIRFVLTRSGLDWKLSRIEIPLGK
jgi:hypothetical protein